MPSSISITFQMASDLCRNLQAASLNSQKTIHLLLRWLCSFIYTGESSTEKVIEVWPAIAEAGQALGESTESFLERMIELYKTGHRLFVRDLCQYAEDEMFRRIIQPPRPGGAGFRCVHCGCKYNFRGCEDRHRGWEDGCNCGEHREDFTQDVRDWIGDLLLLLRLVFEELPDEPTVRARGVCTALDASMDLKTLEMSDVGELQETSRKDISELLEKYDLVAWNVAQRYKKSGSGGWDRSAVNAYDPDDWNNDNGAWNN